MFLGWEDNKCKLFSQFSRYDKQATPTDYGFKKNDEFEAIEMDDRWWKVKNCKTKKSGYASAYYFARKDAIHDYEKSA